MTDLGLLSRRNEGNGGNFLFAEAKSSCVLHVDPADNDYCPAEMKEMAEKMNGFCRSFYQIYKISLA